MCKRNFFTAIRTVSSLVLVVTFTTFVILNINQTLSRSWNFVNNNAQQRKAPGQQHVVVKRTYKLVRRSYASTFSCPGEFRTGYCVIRNYFRASIVSEYNESVTLTTQGTGKFLKHAEELCKRWKGPVSVAVYAPGGDFQQALDEIERLRECGHKCVRRWVSWHFVFDVEHQPAVSLLVPEITHRSWTTCGTNVSTLNDSYIARNKLAYPINVARNVARLAATTHFVLASDIELYPSEGIIPKFLGMIRRLNSNPKYNAKKRQVFVVRIFEVNAKVQTVPSTKEELQSLYKRRLAVFFHEYVCASCHRIPYLDKWMNGKSKNKTSFSVTVKREKRTMLGDWEPFFVGTNDDPLFDERLSWNGKANKMQVALEMCLLDYDFHVLDEIFMVHIPGIKIYSLKEEKPRFPFVIRNEIARKAIRAELIRKYGNQTRCF